MGMTKGKLKMLDIKNKMSESYLKDLIIEMELRRDSFERARGRYPISTPSYQYWDGQLSECKFIIVKLKRSIKHIDTNK